VSHVWSVLPSVVQSVSLGAHWLQRPALALQPAAPHAASVVPLPDALQFTAVVKSPEQPRNDPATQSHVPVPVHLPRSEHVCPSGQSELITHVTVHDSGLVCEQPIAQVIVTRVTMDLSIWISSS
jgi:hypothetical protein